MGAFAPTRRPLLVRLGAPLVVASLLAVGRGVGFWNAAQDTWRPGDLPGFLMSLAFVAAVAFVFYASLTMAAMSVRILAARRGGGLPRHS